MTGLPRDRGLETEVWQWLDSQGPCTVVTLRRATGVANNQIVAEALARLEEDGAVVAMRGENLVTRWHAASNPPTNVHATAWNLLND